MQSTENESILDSSARPVDSSARPPDNVSDLTFNDEPKISEARTAILLVKNWRFFSRNEYSQWLLKYMFQPVVVKEYETAYSNMRTNVATRRPWLQNVQILHISSSRKLHWTLPSANNAAPAKPSHHPRNSSLSILTAPSTVTTNGDISLPTSNVATAVQTPTTPKYAALNFNSSTGGIPAPFDASSQPPVPKKLYKLNPQTRIFTIAKKYRMVFLVDVSSSLGTMDASVNYGSSGDYSMRVKVLMGDVFETLRKCLDGIVRPFCIQPSSTNGFTVQPDPTFHITVIAECSQFASNVNVIPLLVEFPTMRVLLQDAVVNSSNIRHVLQRLQSEFTVFRDQLADFLKDLKKKKKSTMNYVLDVGHSTTGVGITGGLEPTKSSTSGKGTSAAGISNKSMKLAKTTGGPHLTTRRKSDTNSLSKPMSNSATPSVPQLTNLPANTMSASTATAASAKKDMWGIGQTGSNLSYHLHAGLLSLDLLPQDARPILVLITDGVVKSNIQDEEVIRSFAKDDIPCTIIQIGSGQGFTPADNFGFVPDNEILRFLAAATGGKFMYSSDCKMLTDPVANPATVLPMKFTQQTLSSNLLDTSAAASPINTPTVDQFSLLASALASSSRLQPSTATPPLPLYPPNFYHKHFLIRETSYFRQRSDTRYSSMGTASTGLADPPVDVPRERYARSGAGRGGVFGVDHAHPSINDLSFGSSLNFPWDPKSQSPAVETKVVRCREYAISSEISHVIAARLRQGFNIHSVAISENSNIREISVGGKPPEKIGISMILLWLPNVTIEYQIKAVWLPSGTLATVAGNSANNIFLRTKTPRAGVYVGAHSSFAHIFIDAGLKNTSAPGGDSSYPVFAKVHKLHHFLSRIHETDDALKSWTHFNTFNTRFTVRQQLSGRNYSSSSVSSAATLASGQQSSQQSPSNQTEKYIEIFANYWELLEHHDHRSSTKCWYDFAEIDFLVGHVSPYMSSEYNEQYVNNAETEIKEAIGIVEDQLTRTWATFVSKDKIFVRILLKSNNVNCGGSSTPLTAGAGDTINSVDRTYLNSHVPSFCELRLSRDTGCLVTARISFFNVDMHTRRKTVDDLILKLPRIEWNRERFVTAAGGTGGRPTSHRRWLSVCHRPLSHLLMRDTEHYISSDDPEVSSPLSVSIIDSGQKHQLHQLHQQQQHPPAAIVPSAWYIPSALSLRSESIVKNYLRHSSWSWLTDGEEDLYYQDAKIISIQDLAFQFLCQARLDQRYLLVATQHNKNHFYQEIPLDSDVPALATAVQYFIWKDPTGKINTELCMEPTKDRDLRDHFETLKSQMYIADRKTISQLVTFDKIHAIGRNHTKQISQPGSIASTNTGHYHSKGSNTVNDAGTKLPATFDVVSVLRLGKFLIAAYALPVYGIGERSPLDRLANLTVETMLDKSPLTWGTGDNLSSPLSEAATSDPGSLQMGESQLVGGGGGNHSRQTTTDTPRQNYRGHTLQLQKSSPMGSPATDASSIVSTPVASDSIYTLKPDDLLNQHKGSLGKLEYAKRDCALMHFFVEKSLTKLMDGEIPMAQHEPREKFWDEMKKAMVSTDNEYNIFTSHHFVRNLRDTRCFVKIFDSRSFMLILAPSLGIVVDGLEKNISAPLPLQLESDEHTTKPRTVKYMSFLMFECVRQKPLRPVKRNAYSRLPSTESITESEPFEPDQVTFKPMPFLVEESDGLGTTLRPTLFDGQYHTTQGLTKLSERTLRLTQDVSKLYARSFVKSVYSSLLQSHVVDASDFEKVMDICSEASMEIDITGYVNVQTLLNRKGAHRDDLADIQDRFVSVLGHYFEPVNSTNDKHRSIYYYRPPLGKNTRSSSKYGTNSAINEAANALHDILGCAQKPLFIRLECTFKRPPVSPTKDIQETQEVTFPISVLPTSYHITLEGKRYDYEPTHIGTATCPVDSADGTTALLHLVCLTLPSTDDDGADVLVAHQDGPTDEVVDVIPTQPSLVDNMRSRPACLSSLTPDKQEALAVTEARLDWLLTEEIMHGLLRSGPVTQLVLDYIETQLKKKSPFVDFPTSTAAPLNFVRKTPEARAISKAIFLEELTKADISPYSLNRVGDCFYVSEDVVETETDYDSYTTTTLALSEMTSDINQENLLDQNVDDDDDESCNAGGDNLEGLGITIMTPPEQNMMQAIGNRKRIVQKQLFWLLLIPQERSVQIYFYSKAMHEVGRSAIIKHIRNMISRVQERANRLMLLRELNETHQCSKYLVAPESSNPNQDDSEESFDEETGNPKDLVNVLSTSGPDGNQMIMKRFEPGQLACPRVFSKRFPLHWRLKANQALNTLATTILLPLAVINRSHMFVSARNDSVVYIKLSEVGVALLTTDVEGTEDIVRLTSSPYGSNLSLATDVNSMPSTPYPLQSYAADENRPSPIANGGSPRYSSTTSPGSRKPMQTKSIETRELVLEVFGVDQPGRDITEELVAMLESRLMSQITLRIIADFLARNATLKLTAADIDFILPVEKNPTTRKALRIPQIVRNPLTFLLYMRQNILSSQLHALSGPDVVAAVKRHYISMYGIKMEFGTESRNHGDRTGKGQDTLPGDFCFYYNMMGNKNPMLMTPLESAAGQGLAGICLTLLDPSGRPAFQVPYYDRGHMESIDQKAIESCFDQSFYALAANNEFSIYIEIWMMGSVNADAILDHLEKCFRQSLCDYLVEMMIAADVSHSTDEESEISHAVSESILDEELEEASRQMLDPKIRTALVDPCFTVLKKAAEWQSPTAQELKQATNLAPWCMDDFLCELCDALTDMNPAFAPVIIKIQTSSSDRGEAGLEIYQPTRCRQDDEPHEPSVRFVVISGMKELSDKYGIIFASQPIVVRRRSIESDKSHKSHRSNRSHSRRSSVEENDKASIAHSRKEDHASDKGSIVVSRKDDLTSSHHRKDSWTSMPHQQRTQLDGMTRYPVVSREGLTRHCFLLMSLNGSDMVTYTYNWGDAIHEQMFSFINRTTGWHSSRMNVLDSILHQKMGLFHHTEPIMKPIPPQISQSNNLHNLNHHAQPNSHHISGQTPRLGFLSPNPSSLSVTRLSHVDSNGLRNNSIPINSSASSPRPISSPQPIDSASLNSLIYESFPPRLRAGNEHSRFEENKRMPVGEARLTDSSSFSSLDAGAERLAKSPIPAANPTRDSTTTSVKTVEVNDILRDSTAESVADSLNAKAQDVLLRHGPPFMESYARQARLQQAHDNALKIYTKWTKRYKDSKTPEQELEGIAASDLAVVLRSSRLLHFCRTPLLFTDSGNTGVEGDWQSSEFGGDDKSNTLEWYSLLAQKFMEEYSAYLKTIGMQTVIFGANDPNLGEDMENTPFISRFKVSENTFVDCPAVFLLKLMQVGSIMCDVRIQGSFVCVTLYTLHKRHGRLSTVPPPTIEKEEWIRQNFKLFTEECGKFKQHIHVNSFVYDFHLRYIQHTLDSHRSAPLSLNLLQVIQAFVQSHASPASYSRNRIYQDKYVVKSDSIPEGLFNYIMSNPEKYGFETLSFDHKPVACFLSSTFVDFGVSERDSHDEHQQTNHQFKYTLLVCPAEDASIHTDSQRPPDTSKHVVLQYFVIAVYQSNLEQADSLRITKMLKSNPGKKGFNSLEVLTPGSYTVGNIIDNAEKRLKKMIDEAVAFYSRDSLWSRLYRDKSHGGTARSEDFARLAQRFEPLELTIVDPQFRDFLQLSLNWHEVLDTLRGFYQLYARETRHNDTRHLVIFNTQYMDYLVHFQLHELTKAVDVSVVSREKRSMTGKMDGPEKEHIADIAKTIGYYLWKSFSTTQL